MAGGSPPPAGSHPSPTRGRRGRRYTAPWIDVPPERGKSELGATTRESRGDINPSVASRPTHSRRSRPQCALVRRSRASARSMGRVPSQSVALCERGIAELAERTGGTRCPSDPDLLHGALELQRPRPEVPRGEQRLRLLPDDRSVEHRDHDRPRRRPGLAKLAADPEPQVRAALPPQAERGWALDHGPTDRDVEELQPRYRDIAKTPDERTFYVSADLGGLAGSRSGRPRWIRRAADRAPAGRRACEAARR